MPSFNHILLFFSNLSASSLQLCNIRTILLFCFLVKSAVSFVLLKNTCSCLRSYYILKLRPNVKKILFDFLKEFLSFNCFFLKNVWLILRRKITLEIVMQKIQQHYFFFKFFRNFSSWIQQEILGGDEQHKIIPQYLFWHTQIKL